MRRLLLLFALAGCSTPPSDLPPHPDALVYRPLDYAVPDPKALRTTLSTGTPAYLLEDPALPIVEILVFVRGGSFSEPAGKEGVADLTASLMRTGGTSTRDPDALDEELEFLAADLAVTLQDTHGSVSLSVLAKDLDRGLELLADVIRHPLFREDKLETARARALKQMEARNDSTASIEARETNLIFYGDHPVNRLPTRASVESIRREDLAAFHAGLFHPADFIVAAAGAFRKEELIRNLETVFSGWPDRAGKKLEPPALPPDPVPAIHCFHKEGENINQGRVTMGHLGIDIRHPDLHAVRVMSYILGAGGFSSRLMQRVRVAEGLVYDVRSDFSPGIVYPLPFTIEFQSKSESCAYAAKLCLEEISRVREEGVTEEELRNAIQYYLDGFPAFFFSTPLQTVSTYARAELMGIPVDYYGTYREKIARLTREEIRRAAREHLRPEKFAWVVVGDIGTIKNGDPQRGVKLTDLGKILDIPLADPMTLERPR